jgi:hypothetical protein
MDAQPPACRLIERTGQTTQLKPWTSERARAPQPTVGPPPRARSSRRDCRTWPRRGTTWGFLPDSLCACTVGRWVSERARASGTGRRAEDGAGTTDAPKQALRVVVRSAVGVEWPEAKERAHRGSDGEEVGRQWVQRRHEALDEVGEQAQLAQEDCAHTLTTMR